MRRHAIRLTIGVAAIVLLTALSANLARALEVKRVTLNNGMTLLVSPQHNLPMVTAAILFDAGARRDPKGKEGLAHLTADSLMEGTRTIGADEFNRKVDFLGSMMDVEAGGDYSTGAFTSLKRYWRDTLKLLAGVLTDPGLRDEDIGRKQAEQVAGLKAADEEPGYVAQITFLKELFGDAPYGHLPDGTVAAVEKLSADDVRGFYHEYYRPEHAIAAVVGDIEPDEVVKALNEELAAMKGSAPAQKPQAEQQTGSGRAHNGDQPRREPGQYRVGFRWYRPLQSGLLQAPGDELRSGRRRFRLAPGQGGAKQGGTGLFGRELLSGGAVPRLLPGGAGNQEQERQRGDLYDPAADAPDPGIAGVRRRNGVGEEVS